MESTQQATIAIQSATVSESATSINISESTTRIPITEPTSSTDPITPSESVANYLQSGKYPNETTKKTMLIAATRHNRLDVIKYLMDSELVDAVCQVAAAEGRINILEWVSANYTIVPGLQYNAVSTGRMDVLEWLHEKGLLLICGEVREKTAAIVQLLCLLLDTKDIMSDPEDIKKNRLARLTTNVAASTNRLDILIWLVGRGCPLVAKTLCKAIKKGNEQIVSWLLEHNCPFDKEACLRTIKIYGGREEQFSWMMTDKE